MSIAYINTVWNVATFVASAERKFLLWKKPAGGTKVVISDTGDVHDCGTLPINPCAHVISILWVT